MQENNLKGLWIPYEILTNEHLSDKEKYIYSLILFFSKNDGYCTITNKYIANIVNLSDTRVSKLISSLSKKKYVQVITNFQDTTRQIINRKIIPLVKYDNPTQSKSTTHIGNNNNNSSSKDTTPPVENNKYINNNKYNNNNFIILFNSFFCRLFLLCLYISHSFSSARRALHLIPWDYFSRSLSTTSTFVLTPVTRLEQV